MERGATGEGFYRASDGSQWYCVYMALPEMHLSIALARNYSAYSKNVRRNTWVSMGLAATFGFGTAALLTSLYSRRARSLERVTRGVAAIAGGDLDTEIEPLSRDDMRDLARGVNAVTTRLREQVARETEMRQIESFVRVAAMLNHDLKNAINGLSMYVANLESQFENPTFRSDSISALTDATQKLQSLVDRLSNPLTTLSGEYKKPKPTNLTPLVKEVLERTWHPRSNNEIDVQLPDSLIAWADGNRMQTVVENLILNAIEAMSEKPGKLTVKGDSDENGNVVLTFSDTGVGMSQRFIEQKLFHAFATTKRKGMGLGLYTCREVVNAHGGSIEVTSEEGVGTTFRVVLPSPPSNNTEA
jgi:signal transduction histidine kinase